MIRSLVYGGTQAVSDVDVEEILQMCMCMQGE